MQLRPVFIISDRSGLTAETICHTLISQFPDTAFQQEALPFVDNPDKLKQAVRQINQAARRTGLRPLVFTTFVQESDAAALAEAEAEIFDLFDPFISRMEQLLGQRASHQPGQAHGIADVVRYSQRINAVNYSLHCDDGLHFKHYDRATLILLGVSRSGKTPTCLYLALHFGFYAANYPLTEEDFLQGGLPEILLPYRDKTFGLTIDPLRLHQIRTERRPGSDYASLSRCQTDVQRAQDLFNRYRIPYCDSTAYSVEELGSTIKHKMGLPSTLY